MKRLHLNYVVCLILQEFLFVVRGVMLFLFFVIITNKDIDSR